MFNSLKTNLLYDKNRVMVKSLEHENKKKDEGLPSAELEPDSWEGKRSRK
jgi:hypothetical protein